MSRLPFFGAFVSAAILAAPLAAQNSVVVRHVVVRGADAAIEVEIQTSGAPVSPDTQAITAPDRIVVDFPGALPSSELRALKVNRGALKGIRSGLFFDNPPITRVVLDLTEPQSYQIATSGNTTIVKLGPAAAMQNQGAPLQPAAGARVRETLMAPGRNTPAARLSTASLTGASVRNSSSENARHANSAESLNPTLPGPRVSNASTFSENGAGATSQPLAPASSAPVSLASASAAPATAAATPEPGQPALTVTYENGMLWIHAEKATLAEVLFEVQQRTKAEIPIPAGAEQEPVVADLGPAPARDVLSALLNGSPYNFVFVGEELSLERVILTRRDPGSQ